MLKKRFLSAALGMLLLLTVSAPGALAMGETSAAPESEMSVMYTYINQASTSLSISAGGTATVYGFVQKTPAGKAFISLQPCSETPTAHGRT